MGGSRSSQPLCTRLILTLCTLSGIGFEWNVVACQNPPASSDRKHGEPGGSQDCWWALVPRETARKTPAHVLAWFEGVPPDLYLIRKVKILLRLVSCMANKHT